MRFGGRYQWQETWSGRWRLKKRIELRIWSWIWYATHLQSIFFPLKMHKFLSCHTSQVTAWKISLPKVIIALTFWFTCKRMDSIISVDDAQVICWRLTKQSISLHTLFEKGQEGKICSLDSQISAHREEEESHHTLCYKRKSFIFRHRVITIQEEIKWFWKYPLCQIRLLVHGARIP